MGGNCVFPHRLWHELTAKVQAFFAEPKAQKAFVNLFNSFVSMWHKKMNELVYIKLAIITARQLGTSSRQVSLDIYVYSSQGRFEAS